MVRNVKKRNRKPRATGIWILLMSIFIAELFFYTWCRVQNVRVGYEISKKRDKHQNLLTLQNNLEVEFARLRAPERLSEIAKHRFNLTIPTPEQIIVVHEK
jgi:cell division protein FtsL